MAAKYLCLACKKPVTATKNLRYRTHTDGGGERCEQSSVEIPDHVLASPAEAGDDPGVPKEGLDYATCPQCERKVALTRLGYFEPHDQTLRGGDRCPVSGVRFKHARRTDDVPLPGDDKPKPGAERPAVTNQQEAVDAGLAKPSLADQLLGTSTAPTSESAGADSSPPEPPPTSGATEPATPAPAPAGRMDEYAFERQAQSPLPSPESTSTPPASNGSPPAEEGTSSDAPPGGEAGATAPEGPWPLAAGFDPRFLQPFSPFSQPGPVPDRVTAKTEMNEEGKEIAARLREIFYAYTNRNASDNRSAQRTLGPSEIGTTCDRQLAMKLMGVAPVNPQESWAPFVGTAVHAELANMFEWANGAGSGRFQVEMPLSFGSAVVPRGTGDLLDRVMLMFLDHKLMGKYSLKKLIEEGPSETYRVQLHTYAYGATLAGEKVKKIALVGWPREESSLGNLFVHVEDYDPKIAQDAIKRVESLATEVRYRTGEIASNAYVSDDPIQVARTFTVGTPKECTWCPFYNRADKGFTRGCPGK